MAVGLGVPQPFKQDTGSNTEDTENTLDICLPTDVVAP